MFARVVFSVLLASSMTACSSVSDRYAFWRDQNEPANSAHKPNLGDVPPAPNQDNTLAEIEAIRQRLEQDRNNAYMTTQGVIPNELQQPYYPPAGSAPMVTAPTTASSQTVEQTNIYEQNAIYQSDLESAYPAMTNTQPSGSNQWESGDVAYRYDATHNDHPYTYGHSAVAIRSQAYGAAPMPHYVTNDPSISVDWSALADPSSSVMGGSATEYNISSIGLNGQPLVFYAHGSSRIGKGDRAKLRQLANELKNTPHSAVIIGHASVPTGISDPLVARRINLNMSAKRSIAVVHELNRMGVDMNQLRSAAMGDSFASGNEAQDRRVDIMLGR